MRQPRPRFRRIRIDRDGLSQPLLGLDEFTLISVRVAEHDQGRCRSRVSLQHLGGHLLGFIRAPQQAQSNREIAPCIEEFGFERQRPPVSRGSLLEQAQIQPGVAKSAVCRGRFGREFHRSPRVPKRFAGSADRHQGNGQIVLHFGQLRIQLQCAPIAQRRGLGASHAQQHIAEILVQCCQRGTFATAA